MGYKLKIGDKVMLNQRKVPKYFRQNYLNSYGDVIYTVHTKIPKSEEYTILDENFRALDVPRRWLIPVQYSDIIDL